MLDTAQLPVDAIIHVFEEDGETLHSVYHTNPMTGVFVVLLHEGGKFKLQIKKKGFAVYTEWLDLAKQEGYQETQHDIILTGN